MCHTLCCSLLICVINLAQYLQFLSHGANIEFQILQCCPLHMDCISKLGQSLLDAFKLSDLGLSELLELCHPLCPDGTLRVHTAGQYILTILCLPVKTIHQGLESHQTLSSLMVNPTNTTSVLVILRRMDEDTCTCLCNRILREGQICGLQCHSLLLWLLDSGDHRNQCLRRIPIAIPHGLIIILIRLVLHVLN